jgi:preprotein translocase subunit YajC
VFIAAYIAVMVVVAGLFVALPRRRLRAVETLQSQLQEGDEIMTTAGLFGRISRLDQETLDLEIAPGTVVRFARGAVGRRIVASSEPGATSADDSND